MPPDLPRPGTGIFRGEVFPPVVGNILGTNQLARRNLTDEQRLLVLGRMYERQKKEHGGDRKSSGQIDHLKTAEKIASLAGVGQATVRRAAEFAKAVDAFSNEKPPRPVKGFTDFGKVAECGKAAAIFEMWLACYTQEEIAEAVGCDQSVVSDLANSLSQIFDSSYDVTNLL